MDMSQPTPFETCCTSDASSARERLQMVRRLQQQVAGVSHPPSRDPTWVSSGCADLDRQLLGGWGFRRGSLVEWFVGEPGSGAGTLALLTARQACAGGGKLVVLDPVGRFYPPTAVAWGIKLPQLAILRPQRTAEVLWAWDQALRCSAVRAVWGWLDEINDRWFRRFQLAAEQSGCLGLILRPTRYRGDPSWSEVQLAVNAVVKPRCQQDAATERSLCVELVRSRGSTPLTKRVDILLDPRHEMPKS